MNAGQIRDHADRRVRRLTAASIAGAAALTGLFAGIAAASTHFTAKKVVQRTVRTKSVTTTGTVTAPPPTLVPNGSSAQPSAPSSSSGQAPSAAPYSTPPVVVSGGS
jgi:hypothetical protein